MLKLIDDSILEFQEEMLVSVDHRVCYIYFIYVKLGWQYFIFGWQYFIFGRLVMINNNDIKSKDDEPLICWDPNK